jgi:hypothetical protein
MRTATAATLAFGLTLGVLMGWTLFPAGTGTAGPRVNAQVESLDPYNLDYLGDAPDDSLAGAYLALMTVPDTSMPTGQPMEDR